MNKFALILSIAFVSSCGADDSSSNCSTGCVGHGFFQEVSSASASAEIALNNSGENQMFVITPYVLGDDDVNGTSSEQVATVSASGTSEVNDSSQVMQSVHTPLNFDQYDHMIRRVYNSFDRRAFHKNKSKPLKILSHVEAYNKVVSGLFPTSQSGFNAKATANFLGRHKKKGRRPQRLTADTSCPDSLDLEAVGVDEDVDETDFLEKLDNNGEFCVILLGEESQTISDLEEIKSSIATAYGNYKLIYDSLFDKVVDEFSFKPTFVLLPFDSPTLWPGGQGDNAPLKGVTGAYFHQLSVDNDRPILIMPTDVKKVNDALTDEEAKAKYHATLAHELQHAILDYFRYWVNGDQEDESIEIGSLDEGMAHYMESVNGYGDDTFDSFASLFLLRSVSAPTAILDNNDTPLNRGAAHALFHYLVSQKGGIKYKDGTVDTSEESPGITFLRVWVKGKFHGVKGLFDAFDKSKVETIGQFLGALYVDGATSTTPLEIFKNQEIVQDVMDTSGGNNKAFGMRFNNFRNVPDLPDRLSDFTSIAEIKSTAKSLQYYLPAPMIYTTTQENEKLNFSFVSDAESKGITIVRVK